jgi:hypothetical protein
VSAAANPRINEPLMSRGETPAQATVACLDVDQTMSERDHRWRLAPQPFADSRPVPPPTSWPSITVLPFQNIDSDAKQPYFTAGITEEITAAFMACRVNTRLIEAILLRATRRSRSPAVRKPIRLCNLGEISPEQTPIPVPWRWSERLSAATLSKVRFGSRLCKNAPA